MTILDWRLRGAPILLGLGPLLGTRLCDVLISGLGSGTFTFFKKIGVENARVQAINKSAIMRGGALHK